MKSKKTPWHLLVFVIFASILTACSPGQIFGPTVTPTPTTTPLPTATPLPSPTPTLLERIKSLEDFPKFPGASGYEYNGSLLLGPLPPVMRRVSYIRENPGSWDEIGLVTLPIGTTYKDVVSYYKSIGFEFKEWSDTGNYAWQRLDENDHVALHIILDYYEQDENENGPSLLILLSDNSD